MEIAYVEAIHLRLPDVNERCDGSQDTLVVKAHTDAGITGVGEVDSSPSVAKANVDVIAQKKVLQFALEDLSMIRCCFALVFVVPIGLASHSMLALAVPAKPGGFSEKEIHSEDQAWQFSGVDLPKGHVATITAKGQWKTNPLWKQKFGAGGNPATKAGAFYLRVGAREGCLLVRIADTVMAFSSDDDAIEVNTPGKIFFLRQ